MVNLKEFNYELYKKNISKIITKEVLNYLEKYWNLCKIYFKKSDYALSTFFSITLIEEIGKIIYISINNFKVDTKYDRKIIQKHQKKYFMAVGFTLLVNSRVDRIYKDKIKKFFDWLKKDKLFQIRNKSLYIEFIKNRFETPSQAISKEDAFLITCMAGEIYADIQGITIGTTSEEWKKIIDDIDQFRKN